MPIYEYSCKKCGKAFEHLLLGQKDKASCPVCGSRSLSRLMSASAIQVGSDAFDCACPSGEGCMPEGGGGCGMGGMCGF